MFYCGKVLRESSVLTKGIRTVLVASTDISLLLQRPRLLSDACQYWGRIDHTIRKRRIQMIMTTTPEDNMGLKKMGGCIHHTDKFPCGKSDIGRCCK